MLIKVERHMRFVVINKEHSALVHSFLMFLCGSCSEYALLLFHDLSLLVACIEFLLFVNGSTLHLLETLDNFRDMLAFKCHGEATVCLFVFVIVQHAAKGSYE